LKTHLKIKPYRNYTAYYAFLLEPELKMKLTELKTFHDVDVPECIRELLRKWTLEVEKEFLK
jgi:hypothetical protein